MHTVLIKIFQPVAVRVFSFRNVFIPEWKTSYFTKLFVFAEGHGRLETSASFSKVFTQCLTCLFCQWQMAFLVKLSPIRLLL